jgi:drug/metabolite transporter (DMT)-like permease
MKIVILGLLFLIVSSLFVALYTLVKDKGQSNRTVRALTMRVSLSILLIVILLISYKAGLIKPNTSPFNYTLKSNTGVNK